MKSILNNLLFRSPASKIYWLMLALIGRTLYFILELHFTTNIHAVKGFWGVWWYDTYSYFVPIDNLLLNGHYTRDNRMPGYGIIYLPLLLMFTKITALNIFLLIQLVVSSISVYTLALTAKQLFKSDFFFYATFYLFLTSAYTSVSDISLMTESFTTSALIFASYYFSLSLSSPKKSHLFLSGLFITWTIFMRPAYLPLLLVFAALLFIHYFKQKKHVVLALFLFLAPIIIADGAWIMRNYVQYKRFIPLLKSAYYPDFQQSYYFPIYEFERDWGMDRFQSWLTDGDTLNVRAQKVPFPKYIYTTKYNEDTLRAFKSFLNKAIIRSPADTSALHSMSPGNVEIVKKKCAFFIQTLKQEKPFVYYVRSRWALLKVYTMLSMYGDFDAPYLGYFCKILYYIIVSLGFMGILLLARSYIAFSPEIIIPAIPICTIFIHPFLLRLAQNRYFIPSYPFMLICAVYALYWALTKLKLVARM